MNSLEFYHYMIEAMKLAYVDGLNYITDMKEMGDNLKYLLDENYAIDRSKLIGEKAILPKYGALNTGGVQYI